MIDINLAGRVKKTREKVRTERQPPNPKLMIALGCVGVFALIFYLYGDSILGFFISQPEIRPIQAVSKPVEQTQAAPDTQQVEQPPVEQPEETIEESPPPPNWDYGRSMLHISTYVKITRSIPATIDYNVITVTGDRIIAELHTGGDMQFENIQSAINEQLSNYSFSYKSETNDLQVWGQLNAGFNVPDKSPQSKYRSAEANVDALNSLAKEHKVSLNAQDLTGPITRGNLTILPGWIKFQGTEADILAFLERLQEEGVSLNILRITGSPGPGRKQAGRNVQLFFQFELIM